LKKYIYMYVHSYHGPKTNSNHFCAYSTHVFGM
jgi:hypothetical protein